MLRYFFAGLSKNVRMDENVSPQKSDSVDGAKVKKFSREEGRRLF
jgi:hypothetical protein